MLVNASLEYSWTDLTIFCYIPNIPKKVAKGKKLRKYRENLKIRGKTKLLYLWNFE